MGLKEYASFFEDANLRVQEIKKIKITEPDIAFLGELSQTMEKIKRQISDNNMKNLLNVIETDAANLSMSFSDNGHHDPRNNLAGRLGEFKDKFDNFVDVFRRFSKNTTVVSSVILAKELLEKFINLQ